MLVEPGEVSNYVVNLCETKKCFDYAHKMEIALFCIRGNHEQHACCSPSFEMIY